MPHANPESCFEVAARHLFRHVNDVNALRGNPLLRSFFARAKEDGGAAAVLPEVHARILTEAAALCEKHTAAGSETRARRQYAIVVALFAGEPAPHTAARLGISIHHYYRERHVICTGVCKALMETRPTIRFEVADPLRLLFTRSAVLLDQGFARKAVSMLEEACSTLSGGAAGPVVRLELASALISLGFAGRAEELLTESGGLSDDRRAGDITSGWLYDHYVLTKALLAIETGHDADAGRALETLAKRQIVHQRINEEVLDALVGCGSWYCRNGRFSEARTMLRRAHDQNRRLPHTPARQQIAVLLLAARCAENSVDELGLEHYWLSEALALGISNGSACGMLEAIGGLMGYYASIGRDDAAYALAEEGLGIAQATEGTRLLEGATLQIVTTLLRTRYWRAVKPLLFELDQLVLPGSLRWGVLKTSQGIFLARTGRYDRARAPLAEAFKAARNMSNRRFESIILRELAVALHHVGSVGESIEFMGQAVELAEEYAVPYSLWITCKAAARLLPDRRVARLAQQARAKVSARAGALQGVTDRGRDAWFPKPTLANGRALQPTSPERGGLVLKALSLIATAP